MTQDTRVLLVFPASLHGGRWADGPRVKPELVSLFSELRRAGRTVAVLDLEAELGNPVDDEARAIFLDRAEGLLRARPADLVVVSCWSALQYSAAVAVAERARRLSSGGRHRRRGLPRLGAPRRLRLRGRALRLARRRRGGELPSSRSRRRSPTATATRRAAARSRARRCRSTPITCLSSPPIPTRPRGCPELGLFLSRGCPYNAPACLLRPGGAGWHAYPVEVALRLLDEVAALKPERIDLLDPAFGYDATWRRAVLDRIAASDRRDLALTLNGRPDALVRLDLDKMYAARVRLRLDVGTLSRELLSRTGQAPQPQRAVEHALDLLRYANAKGIVTAASLTFNQPGETEATRHRHSTLSRRSWTRRRTHR